MKRSSSVIPGMLFILAGVLVALIPQFIFPVCDHGVATAAGGSVPMKCFWTARAELGVGTLIAFGGMLYCLTENPGLRLGVSAMTAACAVLAMAFPAGLIGVCGNETMPCHMGTLPGVVLTGAGTLVLALAAMLCNRASMRKGEKT